MNKISLKLIAVFAALSVFSACEKNFDAQIYGQLSTTNFPKTEADYENYLMECYLPFIGAWSYDLGTQSSPFYVYSQGILRILTAASDECAINTNWGWINVFNGQFEYYETAGRWTNDWQPVYLEKIREITRFTKLIGDLQDAPEGVLPAQKKTEFIAEARLIRGIVMYYLLHLYGPVPVILDPALVGNAEAESDWSRPSLAEMAGYIADDLEYAAGNMRESQPVKGRYTADYARVFLMRHYLNEGSHMDGYYKKAYDLYNEFTGGYELFKAGENPYADQFKLANEFNCETIMAVSVSPEADLEQKNGNGTVVLNYCLPMDVSPVDDKGVPTEFAKWSNWCCQIYAVNPSFYDTFEPGDLRAKTIVTRYYSGWGRGWIGPEHIGDLWNGYILNKFPAELDTAFQGTDHPLARWAEVLLLRAEADVRLNNSVSDEAVGLVNQIRDRAGIGPLTEQDTASPEAFLDAILEERGHELFFEGYRKIDLIRFGKYYSTMDALGRTPTSQYLPMPNYAMDEAAAAGVSLQRYYTRPDYDGPQRSE